MKLSFEKGLYIFGWVLAFAALLFLGAYSIWKFDIFRFSTGCIMYDKWNLYCPGCGGTRAVKSLLTGHIFKSIYYNPLVVYGGVVYGWFMISHTLSIMTKGRIHGMKYDDKYAYAAIIIMFSHFVVKNVLIFMGIIV